MRKSPSDIEEIEQAIRDIARQMHANKAILFGSSARGMQPKCSDVDVVFVQETTERFLDRASEPMRLLSQRIHGRGIDILKYTPNEFEKMDSSGNFFIRNVFREGKLINGA